MGSFGNFVILMCASKFRNIRIKLFFSVHHALKRGHQIAGFVGYTDPVSRQLGIDGLLLCLGCQGAVDRGLDIRNAHVDGNSNGPV